MEIIIEGFVSDYPFAVLSVSDADIETGESDGKDMRYSSDDIRCVFFLVERENIYIGTDYAHFVEMAVHKVALGIAEVYHTLALLYCEYCIGG